jgi:acetoacetate decarboxylase
MKEVEVKARAFAMPLTSPAYPPGPYRFVNREFMVITYRTDPDRVRAVIPEPLEMDEPLHLVCDLTLGLGKVAHDYLHPSASKHEPAFAPATAGVA